MIACKRCKTIMVDGKALAQTVTGSPDFPGDRRGVTLSVGGPGVLIDCLKCPSCGWSMTHPKNAQPISTDMPGPEASHSEEVQPPQPLPLPVWQGATPLGRVAFVAYHGYAPADDQWDAGDRIVQSWESAAGAVAAVEREANAKVLDAMADQAEKDMEPSAMVAYFRERAAFIRSGRRL